MTVTTLMPVRTVNLVVPLPHEGTAMRTAETAATVQARPGAVAPLTGESLRPGDVDCTNHPSTRSATRGSRTSTTATRTTTTRATRPALAPSADSQPCSFEQLVAAYLDCRRHKRNSTSALAFEANLEHNLCDLFNELQGGSYRPGRSICCVITRPKPREVWAADFRDRIVHHLIYAHIGLRFEAAFVANSCACIKGRGTLYAAERLEHAIRSVTHNWSRPAWYLKCDLANFFVTIDKNVLRAQLARRVGPGWWFDLVDTVLMHDPRADVDVRGATAHLALVPPHKSLFNAAADTGLPIGNLSSQFFANVLLNDLDQRAKHQLHARHYVRYVDDFILLHESPQWLNDAHAMIDAFLPATLGVRLNPKKTILQPVDRGIDFVGQVIKPWRRSLRRRTFNDAISRTKTIASKDLFETANSYFGLMRQATSSHHDRARFSNVLRQRGHSIKSDLTKTYRKANP